MTELGFGMSKCFYCKGMHYRIEMRKVENIGWYNEGCRNEALKTKAELEDKRGLEYAKKEAF